MARLSFLGAIVAVGAAVLYQRFLHTLIFHIAGVGRSLQPISDFPYDCKQIHHEELASCEDLWLDNEHRQLYLACTGMQARTANRYDTGVLNASELPDNIGWISVLNIDEPGADGLYGLRSLGKGDFKGYRGEGSVSPSGFGVEKVDAETLRFFITDLAPAVDPQTKKPLEQISSKKRSAIQVFKHRRGSNEMQHEYELAGDAVSLPNRVTVLKDGNVMLTNDHTHSGGLRRMLEVFTGGGNIAYCNTTSRQCDVVVQKGTGLPNGLQLGPDGLVYVPNCYTGQIQSYDILPNNSVILQDAFFHPASLDNLAFDAAGDLWAPGIPKAQSFWETMDDPYRASWHSTIWRFRRQAGNGPWMAQKMLEDSERQIVSGITTVEHDAKTGRLFLSGAYIPHIVVCEPRRG